MDVEPSTNSGGDDGGEPISPKRGMWPTFYVKWFQCHKTCPSLWPLPLTNFKAWYFFKGSMTPDLDLVKKNIYIYII